MDQHRSGSNLERPPPRLSRRLSPAKQLSVLGLGTAALLALLVASGMVGIARDHREPVEPSSPVTEGPAFRPTDKQWQALKIRLVGEAAFQDSVQTEGKIAIDDDLVTPVFSPLSGHVTRLLARAGDVVRQGDPLYAIRSTELAQAQNDLIVAAAGLRTARAQLNLATTNEKRQHDLYNAQGAALKDWQQSQVDLAGAQGGLNNASIALSAVRSRLRILGKTSNEIDEIEAAPDILRLDADSIVRAPIGGTIVTRQIGLGQNIISASSGATSPVFMIGELSKVWLVANAREESAPFLHVGDTAEASVLAYPSRTFKAKLTYVAASIDPATHRLPVRAEVENPNGELKPEMFASFRITTGKPSRGPAIPVSAIVHEGDSQHVWIADPTARTLEMRDFQAGPARDGLVQALSGIRVGESIVTAGALFIDRAVTGD